MARSCPVLVAGALSLALWGAGSARAPGAPLKAETREKNLLPAERVREALDKTVSVDVAEASLDDVLQYLSDRSGVPMRREPTLVGLFLEPDPITLKLKDVKVRSALRTLLPPYGLSYAIIGDSVVIGMRELMHVRQLQQPVSVRAEGIPLTQALRQLSRETATNIVLDPRVAKEAEQAVSLDLEEVPLNTAVQLMALMAGLKVSRMGNVLVVSSKETAREIRSEPELVPSPPPMDPNGGAPFGMFGNPLGIPGGLGLGRVGGAAVPGPMAQPPQVAPPAVPPDADPAAPAPAPGTDPNDGR